MAEVQCPSPFSASGSLKSNIQVSLLAADCPDVVTWNPDDKIENIVLSSGDLTATHLSGFGGSVRATNARSSGKWYWEIHLDSGANHYIGIATSAMPIIVSPGRSGNNSYSYEEDGDKWYSSSSYSYGDPYSSGDVIGIALDLDSHKIWWSKNNVWQGSGDPANGTNPGFTILSDTFFPAYGRSGVAYQSAVTARFISGDQTYSPPSGFNTFGIHKTFDPFIADGSLSVSKIYPGYIDLDEAFLCSSSLSIANLQQETPSVGAFVVTAGGASPSFTVELSCNGAFSEVSTFSCDHCFNYAQIDVAAPTPTCKMSAVFRYARIDAEPPTPTASFTIGKRIQDYISAPDFTCTAYSGRNPSIIASASCPTCSMRVGLSLSDEATLFNEAGVPIPTCTIIATTDHLPSLYGDVPVPTCTIIADTENIAIINASISCPRGLFTTTIGNVADIYGRVSVPICSMVALTGTVVNLSGRVPVPGPLVRFYASPLNVNITLEGDVPVPTMISGVRCSLPSLILRHGRGDIR